MVTSLINFNPLAKHHVISITELWEIYNLSLNLICIINKEGYFKHVNPSFLNELGFVEEELINKPFNDFVHPEDSAANNTINAQLINTKQELYFTSRLLNKRGDYKYFSWSVTAISKNDSVYAIASDSWKTLRNDGIDEE